MRLNQTEAQLLIAVKHLLHLLEHGGFLTYTRLNVSGIPISRAGKIRGYRRNVDMVGVPDLIIWITNGPTVCVELKQEKGKLSEHQLAFKKKIESVGHIYAVVKSLDQLESVLMYNGLGKEIRNGNKTRQQAD